MDRDPVLVGGAEGFPIELVLLFFIVIGIIALTFWLSRALGKREGEKSREARREAITAEASARPPGLLRLEHEGGAWRIYVNGERYPSLDAVPDPDVREEVVAGLRQLVLFSRDYVKKQPNSKGKRKTQAPVQKPQAPPTEPKPPSASSPTPEPAPRPKPSQEPGAEAPPSPGPRGQLEPEQAAEALRRLNAIKARAKRRAESQKAQPHLSAMPGISSMMPHIDLAREIGAIVDEMQAQVPQLHDRSIRLHNTASGGIQFAIDGIVYEDVNDIPNELVRKLIKAATREWERR
ncbi:MAG: hypothetical protein ACLFTI_08165 [Anaerolineales bacterium]